MLCGDGVRGCHGRLEAADPVVRNLLVEHIRDERPDVIEYLAWAWRDGAILPEFLVRELALESAPGCVLLREFRSGQKGAS